MLSHVSLEQGGAQQDEADRIVADLLRVAEEADSSQVR